MNKICETCDTRNRLGMCNGLDGNLSTVIDQLVAYQISLATLLRSIQLMSCLRRMIGLSQLLKVPRHWIEIIMARIII